MKKMAMSL